MELSGQEIESLGSILNEKEIQTKIVADIMSQEELLEHFGGIEKDELVENDVKFLVKMSIVPKMEDDSVKFTFIDQVMKNEITIRALPPVEIVIAITSSYPSKMRPLFVQTTPLYSKWIPEMEKFLCDSLNEKWSEEMPVLYELAIFIQDEFLE